MVSAIFLTPIREDNGKYITCRADVPGLPGYRQQSVKMEVKCMFSGIYAKDSKTFSCIDAPTTSIKLGGPLELERIEEGHDVYFECNIDANPPANSIMWQHNVRIRNIVRKPKFLNPGADTLPHRGFPHSRF